MSAYVVILVIDDDRFSRTQIRSILENQYLDVVEAENGEDGLALIETHRPDIVLLDSSMPVMDGSTTLVKIRKRYDSIELPVIVVTTDKTKLSEYQMISLGAQAFITKPLSPDVLVDCVDKLLNKTLKPSKKRMYRSSRVYAEKVMASNRAFLEARFRDIVASFVTVHLVAGAGDPPEADALCASLDRIRDGIVFARIETTIVENMGCIPDAGPTEFLREFARVAHAVGTSLIKDGAADSDVAAGARLVGPAKHTLPPIDGDARLG